MPGSTGINWTTQGLKAYLTSIGLGGRPTAGIGSQGPVGVIFALVNTLTTLFTDKDVTFSLENMMNGVIPDIVQICKGTFDIKTGACTNTTTISNWIKANRPDINATYNTALQTIIATYINTYLMPTSITCPSYLTTPPTTGSTGPSPIDAMHIYVKGVDVLLHDIAKYLRHYCEATSENWTTSYTSSSYGSYVAPLPETLY
jgi:hypothetical protein